MLTGKLTPDGYFSLGIAQLEKIRPDDKQYERDLAQYWDSYWEPGNALTPGKEVFFQNYSTDVLPKDVRDRIGLSTVRNFNRPTQYGLNGITARGKRTVRSAVSCLEQMYDKSQLGFLTLTVPELTWEARDAVNANWNKITNHLLTVLKRELKAKSGLDYLVGVTEVQEKRWKANRTLYYHFHIVFVAHFGDFRYFISPSKIRLIWMRCLNSQLSPGQKLTPQNVKATEQLKTINKSVTRYIGKYMSKGFKAIKGLLEVGIPPEQIPRQWWLCTRSLGDIVKRCTRQVTPAFINLVLVAASSLCKNPVFSWIKPIEVSVNGAISVIGYIGYLRPRVLAEYLRTFDMNVITSPWE